MWFLFLWNRYASNSLVINPDWPTNTYKYSNQQIFSELCSHRKGGSSAFVFQSITTFSAVMVGEVNNQLLVLSFRLSNLSILDHEQTFLFVIHSIWSGYFWQTTVEVPDEEKKVFVGGLPHDCKHEDVKVLTWIEEIEYINSKWGVKECGMWQLSPFSGTL